MNKVFSYLTLTPAVLHQLIAFSTVTLVSTIKIVADLLTGRLLTLIVVWGMKEINVFVLLYRHLCMCP